MKIKVSEATGQVLDWMVAKCEGFDAIGYEKSRLAFHVNRPRPTDDAQPRCYQPSTNWAQGGPIIEKERIDIYFSTAKKTWAAAKWVDFPGGGELQHKQVDCPTLLISVMRCFVVSKLGDEVEVPEELCQT